jgi:hypothetical protein
VRIICIMLPVFLFCFLGSLHASILEKEFSFELNPDETDHYWEINIPFPSGESGNYVGRDFMPVVTDSSLKLFVDKELLSEQNYYMKIRLLAVSPKTNNKAKLLVKLETGSIPKNDVPEHIKMVGWTLGKSSTLRWLGRGDTKGKLPISARYLYYKITKNDN